MKIQIGCGPFPHSRKKYLKSFNIVEISETFYSVLTPAVAKRWHGSVKPSFKYITTAPQWLTHDPLAFPNQPPANLNRRELGFMRPTEANRELWKQVHEQSMLLGGASILFKTPPTFFPSRRNKSNFKRFLTEIIGEISYKLIWEPRGVWEAEDALAFATEIGVTLAQDPYVEPEFPLVPEGEGFYILTAPRGRRRFDEDDFELFVDFLQEHKNPITVLFRGPDRDRHAKMLAYIVKENTGNEE